MITVIASDRVPKPFLVLGAGGLIPFVAGALALWLLPPDHQPYARHWLLGYAMVILAFVGAIHWGVTMQARQADTTSVWIASVWSVLPALVAWSALALPGTAALLVLAGMFALQLFMDRWLARRFSVPSWFLRLRAGLTAVAVTSLVAAVLAS